MLKLWVSLQMFLMFCAAGTAFAETAIYQRGDTPYICNDQSPFTNLRRGPSARDYPTVATLPNNLRVRSLYPAYTPEGYVYYSIAIGGPEQDDIRYGFVHQDVLHQTCTLAPVYSPDILNLADKFGRANGDHARQRVLEANANYDGRVLYLKGTSIFDCFWNHAAAGAA